MTDAVPTRPRVPQVTRWCYTLYAQTLTEDYGDANVPPVAFPTTAKFATCQLERCPTSGKLHLQGFVVLSRSARLATVKKIPGYETAHWEPAKGKIITAP